MKTKVKIEVCNRKKKNYVQVYLEDSDLLIHTYIVREEDTLCLGDFYLDLNEAGTVSDFS